MSLLSLTEGFSCFSSSSSSSGSSGSPGSLRGGGTGRGRWRGRQHAAAVAPSRRPHHLSLTGVQALEFGLSVGPARGLGREPFLERGRRRGVGAGVGRRVAALWLCRRRHGCRSQRFASLLAASTPLSPAAASRRALAWQRGGAPHSPPPAPNPHLGIVHIGPLLLRLGHGVGVGARGRGSERGARAASGRRQRPRRGRAGGGCECARGRAHGCGRWRRPLDRAEWRAAPRHLGPTLRRLSRPTAAMVRQWKRGESSPTAPRRPSPAGAPIRGRGPAAARPAARGLAAPLQRRVWTRARRLARVRRPALAWAAAAARAAGGGRRPIRARLRALPPYAPPPRPRCPAAVSNDAPPLPLPRTALPSSRV